VASGQDDFIFLLRNTIEEADLAIGQKNKIQETN
jgi:hypothetical protein